MKKSLSALSVILLLTVAAALLAGCASKAYASPEAAKSALEASGYAVTESEVTDGDAAIGITAVIAGTTLDSEIIVSWFTDENAASRYLTENREEFENYITHSSYMSITASYKRKGKVFAIGTADALKVIGMG